MTGQRHMVEVRNVSCLFGRTRAVDHASFQVEKGKFLTILGPSGCGKTTLLRMIAGFLTPDEGEIFLHGQPMARQPAHKRSIGMVFQKLALFPHMTAAQNVAYPLKMRRFDPARIPALVRDYLALVKLDGLADRLPAELSGGQQQRVAIARALVFGPDLLLLDEPLSALDKKLREEMQLEFRRIQKELDVTTINVTHDQREALVMSDRIIVMKDGVIQQTQDPVSLYRQPQNRFVAGFMGLTAFLAGTVEGGDDHIRIGSEILRGRASGGFPAAGTAVDCAIRAEQVRICNPGDATGELDNCVAGIVEERIFEGDRLVYEVRCPSLDNALLYVFDHDPAHHAVFEPQEPVKLAWNARDLMVFN